jgi:type I restriction enzyme S subunit
MNPTNMKILPFAEVFEDISAGNVKIKQSDYLSEGVIPIVDQGQSLIGGYSNFQDSKCKAELPVVIFGDHTRVVKFIDFPFILGADGVKVLKNKCEADIKYLYYCLKNSKIPDTGYNRHYKFLKELKIPLPPLPIQKKIAAVLEKADDLRRKREEQIKRLDDLLQATFLDMFGDPVTNPKGWPKKKFSQFFEIKTGKLDANAMVENGPYPFFTCAKEEFRIDNYAFDQEALLLAGNNAAGKYDVKHYKGKFNAYQRTYVLSTKDLDKYPFAKILLEKQLGLLQHMSKGTNTRYITLEILERLPMFSPAQNLQDDFCKVYDRYQGIRKQLENDNFEELFNSLMQRAFKGELDLK